MRLLNYASFSPDSTLALPNDSRQLVTLRQLRAFLRTAQNASASAAARTLGVSQPAVSQQIQDLEKLLRVRLFDRVGIRMLPNAAGLALIEPARRVLAAMELVEPAVAPFRDKETAQIRLGTGATLCIHLLPELIARAKSHNPALHILVMTGNVDELVGAVEEGVLDLALVTTERLNPGPAFVMQQLFDEEFVAILPPALAAVLPSPVRADDLMQHPLILFEPAGRTREIMDNWFIAQGIRPVASMELGSVEAIKTMVAAGLGVSFVPGLALSRASPGLVRKRLHPPLKRHLSIVMRADKVPDAGLRSFVQQLRTLKDLTLGSVES